MSQIADTVRVLHVEDDRAFADLAAEYLEREADRVSVETVYRAEDGLEALDDDIDCVVSDYEMPGTDGIEFLKQVRDRYPDLPFILFTGKGSEAVAGEAISAGVTDYLQKSPGSEQFELLCNRIENAIAKQRAQTNYRELFEKTPVGLTIHEPESGRIIDANQYFGDLLGYEAAELEGTHPGDLSPAGSRFDRERANRLIQEAIETGSDRTEWQDETKSGDPIWVEVELERTTLDGQQRVLAAVQEITERRQRARELQVKDQIVREMNDGAVIAQDGEIKYTNPQVSELVGYAEEELSGKPMLEFIKPADRELVKERHQARVSETGPAPPEQYEITLITKQGRELPVEINVSQIEYQGHPATVSLVRDISARKAREQELEEARELTDALSTTFPDYTFIYNEEGDYLDVITGWEGGPNLYSPEELVGRNVEEVLSSETADRIRTAIGQTLETGELQTIEYSIEPPGQTRWYEANLAPLEAGYGGEQAVVLTARDVTERKESEERYRRLLATSPTPIFIYSRDEELIYANEAAVEFLGADDREEILGSSAGDFTHPESLADVERRGQTLIEDRESVPPLEEKIIDVNGNEKHALLASAPVQYEGMDAIQTVATDVTELKEREQELERRNERLDELARIVSHDLRNPLSVAEGRLQLAIEERDWEPLDAVSDAHDRMETLIDDMLSLANVDEEIGDLEPVELADLADRCWQNVETASATLDTDTTQTIAADDTRVQQVLENLFRNAIEHGGTDVTITIGPLDEGFYVEDDGPGIPPEDRADVFDPGYSTMEDGTGFGLSIVRDIAEAHDWQIEVTDGSEGGARFEFTGVEVR